MICSKCGKNESKYETRLGFLCLECYNNSLKEGSRTIIKCSVCGRTIFSGDFYASGEDNETFCLHCLNDRSDKATDTNEDKINRPVHLKKGNRPAHILPKIMYVFSVVPVILYTILGIVNFNTSYGHSVLTIFYYSISGLISGVKIFALGKLVEAAGLYIFKNKRKFVKG